MDTVIKSAYLILQHQTIILFQEQFFGSDSSLPTLFYKGENGIRMKFGSIIFGRPKK